MNKSVCNFTPFQTEIKVVVQLNRCIEQFTWYNRYDICNFTFFLNHMLNHVILTIVVIIYILAR